VVHVVLHIFGKTVEVPEVWHSGCSVSPSGFPSVVGTTAEVTAVSLFLATDVGSVSWFFAVEAQVASHEVRFLGLGVLLSTSSGIDVCGDCSVDVHMVSSLRGGALVVPVPPVVVPSVTASPRVVDLPRGEFEGLEESLTSLGELSCRLLFEMGFAGLFFPFFESPGDFGSGVVVGGINDGTSESLSHAVLEGFDSSLIV